MSWLLLLIILLALLIPTAYAGYIGAPYVPVRRPALTKAFNKLKIGPADFVVDLGAGDGGVVLEATRRGAKAIGYELSPIMWAVARLRGGRVFLRNFYTQSLPPETTHIFVFLMPQNLSRLLRYLKKQHLPNAQYLLSYTFPFPNIQPHGIIQTPRYGAVYIYDWEAIQEA